MESNPKSGQIQEHPIQVLVESTTDLPKRVPPLERYLEPTTRGTPIVESPPHALIAVSSAELRKEVPEDLPTLYQKMNLLQREAAILQTKINELERKRK